MKNQDLLRAVFILEQGGIIAYPTEAVYGLGCDPFNELAVKRLISIKGRNSNKGFLLIASSWEQIQDLIKPIPSERLTQILSSWPGAKTWVFPASDKVPIWIMGDHDSIALRITDHPIARELCTAFQSPLVSTSANKTNQKPAVNSGQVKNFFKNDEVDFILEGKVGGLSKPTPIYDAITGEVLRE